MSKDIAECVHVAAALIEEQLLDDRDLDERPNISFVGLYVPREAGIS